MIEFNVFGMPIKNLGLLGNRKHTYIFFGLIRSTFERCSEEIPTPYKEKMENGISCYYEENRKRYLNYHEIRMLSIYRKSYLCKLVN